MTLRTGQFIHVVEVTTPSRAMAELGPSSYATLRPILDQFVVIEKCRTYPDPMNLVKVCWSGDDQARANVIGQGYANTYGAKFFDLPIHDRATCQHEDCRWARMDEAKKRDIEAWSRDADRIDATPGRYW